jgi:hypothetical protein
LVNSKTSRGTIYDNTVNDAGNVSIRRRYAQKDRGTVSRGKVSAAVFPEGSQKPIMIKGLNLSDECREFICLDLRTDSLLRLFKGEC